MEILKALGLKQQFQHGIYEDKLGTICFIGCVYASPNQENNGFDLECQDRKIT